MKISPARTAAFDILIRIENDNAYSSALLPLYEEKLSERDAALCHELTLGVLRQKLYLDRIIDLSSGGRKIDIEVRICLRLGLFQLLFLDRIPEHAAIDESVNLALRAKKRSAKGFVNAILRAYQREPILPGFSNALEELSISTSHPQWLAKRWIDHFGLEETIELCKTNNKRPPNVFRVLDPATRETIGSMIDTGIVKRSEFVDGAFISKAIQISSDVYFQDEGSQLAASAVIAEAGSRVLDVCAAPGGKTTMIATSVNSIVAGDVHSNRVELLQRTCEKLKAENVTIVQYDARTSLPFDDRSFDVVFVDAPCSGTGTIRHNPEIRYSLRETDINELSRKQRLIVKNASEQVKVGGKLIYATCSLEPEENELVCNDFGAENDSFARVDPKVPKLFLTKDGYARTLPHRDEMDGFFIGVFERKS